MTKVILNKVSKQYRDDNNRPVTAVDTVSFRVSERELLAIIGPSGCGKSTVLRLIAGLEKADSGEITYDGVSMLETPTESRGIGMVFQEGALMPHWDSRRTIGFFLRLRQREHEVPERVKRISQITGIGLDALMDRRPRQLSGGEKQRVAVARALARDLQLLLFDEPFSNLDAKLRTNARIELRRLINEFPVTAVYVTHDQEEAVILADRIAVMNEGRVEQIGNYDQLYHTPRNLFVAKFFGTPAMNFFEGEIREGKWYGLEFGGYPVRSDFEDGAAVTMGIRPQYMHLKPAGAPGVVDTVFPFLAERYQLVNVWLGKEKWSLTVPLNETIEIGSTIYCGLNPEHAQFFDTQTGLRIG
jgi:ABC-type sugar transport system ATPase subunit